MARYYDIIIDGDGGVLTLESGASMTLEDGSSLVITGNTALAALRSGAVLEIGQDGVSSAYVDVWENSAVRFRDTSTLLFLANSIMRGTVSLDTGLTFSSGSLNLSTGVIVNLNGNSRILLNDTSYIQFNSGTYGTLRSNSSIGLYNSANTNVGIILNAGGGTGGRALLDVQASSGEVIMRGSGGNITVANGIMTVASGAAISIEGNGLFIAGSCDVTGTGHIDIENGCNLNVEPGGQIAVAGNLALSGAGHIRPRNYRHTTDTDITNIGINNCDAIINEDGNFTTNHSCTLDTAGATEGVVIEVCNLDTDWWLSVGGFFLRNATGFHIAVKFRFHGSSWEVAGTSPFDV